MRGCNTHGAVPPRSQPDSPCVCPGRGLEMGPRAQDPRSPHAPWPGGRTPQSSWRSAALAGARMAQAAAWCHGSHGSSSTLGDIRPGLPRRGPRSPRRKGSPSQLTSWCRCSRPSAPSCHNLTLSSTDPVARMFSVGDQCAVQTLSSWLASILCCRASRIVRSGLGGQGPSPSPVYRALRRG